MSAGGAGGALVYVLTIIYLVLSVYGFNGAITYKTGLVRAAVAGYWIKAVLMIMLLTTIVSIFDKDGRYESNGNTYEIVTDKTTLIIFAVICK